MARSRGDHGGPDRHGRSVADRAVPRNPWVSIAASALFIVFNLFGLPHIGWYDNFLIAVSFVFNALIIWHA